MNLRFHADIEDSTIVHGTYWGSADGDEPDNPLSSSMRTKRLTCDGSPIILMMGILTGTEEPVTCLECIAKMR